MRNLSTCVLGLMVAAGLASSVSAAVVGGTGSTTMFGRSYGITRWDLAGDLGTGAAGTTLGVPLEALTVHNGTLYVWGDNDPGQFEGRFLAYNTGATASLAAPQLISTTGDGIGPEGITVNTSGSGFGSFSGNNLVITAVEGSNSSGIRGTVAVTGNTAAVTNSGLNVNSPGGPVRFEPDDIAYLPGTQQFAVLGRANGAGIRTVRLFDNNLADTGVGFNVEVAGQFARPRGMATIDGSFASFLTGINLPNSNYLVIPNDRFTSGDASGTRRLRIYDLSGNIVASTLVPFFSAAGDIQSIAIDNVNGIFYFGDQAQRVWSVAIPSPSGAAVVGLGLLAAARRRRA